MSTYRVLHLEDNPNDAELVSEALNESDHEYEIFWVDTGESFRSAIHEHEHLDIILMDYSVPGCDGMEALKFAKDYHPDTPVIIVSGAIADERAVDMIKYGAFDYVLKDHLLKLPAEVEKAIAETIIIEEKHKQEHLQYEILRSLGAGLFKIDLQGNVTYVSETWASLIGTKPESFYGRNWINYINSEDRAKATAAVNNCINSAEPQQIEFRLTNAKGQTIWVLGTTIPRYDYKGNLTDIVGLLVDITEVKNTQAKLNRLERFNPLTGLANRDYFTDVLQQLINEAQETQTRFSILHIDIDNFRKVNEAYGFQNGDQLLQNIGQRLQHSIPNHRFLAHIAGDEFIIIVDDLMKVENQASFARYIQSLLREPFYIEDNKIYITVSIGIAFYPESGTTVDALTKNVNQALKVAKTNDGDRFEFFTQTYNEQMSRLIEIEKQLRDSLDMSDFYLVYHPQINLRDNKVHGMEVLIRWQNDKLGVVPPSEFIPIAEENGLINKIGVWLTEKAMDFMKQLDNNETLTLSDDFQLSINLSPRQLQSESIIEDIARLIKDKGLDCSRFTFELTETAIIQSPQKSIPKIKKLHELGFSLALDDFGTGYSSLTYLKELPLEFIKIDTNFTQDLTARENSYSIVSGMIMLAKALGITVIAEGVETEGQLAILEDLKCSIAQGYYYSKPLTADKAIEFIKQHQ